jgi:hypothetical protein
MSCLAQSGDTFSLGATRIGNFDQVAFVRALLDPHLPPPAALKDPGSAQRFEIYRNNVIGGLINALCERFPVCLRLVGEEFFRPMAYTYVSSSLPRTRILSEYGETFAAFIAGFEPASDLPYLPDIARLEYAAGQAYHAVDATPLSLDFLRNLLPHRLEAATASLHPSAQVIRSEYPIVSIWRENVTSNPPRTVVLDNAEDALVVRPRLDVEIRALPPGGGAFVEGLMDNCTLGDAAREAHRIAADFDLTGCLATLLACEAFSAIDVGDLG